MREYNRSSESQMARREIINESQIARREHMSVDEDVEEEKREALIDLFSKNTINGRLEAARYLLEPERSKALKRWREDMAKYQAFWGATLRMSQEMIERNPEITNDEFTTWFDKHARNWGFNPVDIDGDVSATEDAQVVLIYERQDLIRKFKNYQRAHSAVQCFHHRNPDDLAKYQAIVKKSGQVNVSPRGEIVVEVLPAAIHFQCENIEDYVALSVASFGGDHQNNDEQMNYASHYPGVFSVVNVDYENVPVIFQWSDSGNKAELSEHERRHALNSVLIYDDWVEGVEAASLNKAIENRNRKEIENALLSFRARFEVQAQDEILAYLKGGRNYRQTKEILAAQDGSPYDYLGKYRADWQVFLTEIFGDSYDLVSLDDKQIKILKGAIDKVFSQGYKTFIEENVDILADLEYDANTYTRSDIIDMFTNIPIRQWKKVVGILLAFERDYQEQENY